MSEKDFTEREFSGFDGLGELPEDLRSVWQGGVSGGGTTAFPTVYTEGEGFSYNGGADRAFVQPIPSIFSNRVDFTAISYLPRANIESFRAQRFFAFGGAMVPFDTTPLTAASWVPLFVDQATMALPNTFTSGTLVIPPGFAAVITGFRQWVGDSNAFDKPDAQPDDISWRITLGGTSAFNMGNLRMLISTLEIEAKQFIIVSENTPIQLSVANNLTSTDPFAREIPVKGMLTGHWFPIDELDDIFRNR